MLSAILFLPIVGAVLLALMPRRDEGALKTTAFVVSLITFALSVVMALQFNCDRDATLQFVEHHPWAGMPQLGLSYYVGVDGLSVALVLLTTLLSAVSILSAWNAIRERVKEFFIFLLFLETGMLGVFMARDLLLFYVFWEVMLLPMYFIIGIWGGPRRVYATIKFVLYTLVGSLLMLVAILVLYLNSGPANGGQPTFDLDVAFRAAPALPHTMQLWLFLAFGLAFAIKVPMFPFHTWLPDAHVEAPTAGSVLLAGVLLKMGTYGFLRFCIMLFPSIAVQLAPAMIVLAVIGIVYGALVALVQTDVKKLVAYSSVSHLGFVLLGMFALNQQGMQGAVLQMINHGLSTGGLFLLVGMIYERRHTRDMSEFGGLWRAIPIFTLFFLITTLSSVGLPGLNGFIGEFLILLGSFARGVGGFSELAQRVWTGIGATGVILGAAYLLWMFQKVAEGPLSNPENQRLTDLTPREIAVLTPLVVMMFVIGIYPNLFLRQFDQTVRGIVAQVQTAVGPAVAHTPGGRGHRTIFTTETQRHGDAGQVQLVARREPGLSIPRRQRPYARTQKNSLRVSVSPW